MQRVHADNRRKESRIDFVFADRHAYLNPDEFYAAAIRTLWEGWDSGANADKYIAKSKKTSRTVDELRIEVASCLGITPVSNFDPELRGVESVWSFRDDWNVKEFVWCSDKEFGFMSWDTSA